MSESGRTAVLARIKSATQGTAPAAREVVPGLNAPRPAIKGDVLEAFTRQAEANLMVVRHVSTLAHVPEMVGAITRESNLGNEISVAPALVNLVWPSTLAVRTGPARIDERISVNRASAGIAETGSLVMCSGTTAPAGLTFAPEVSIVVLDAKDVRPYLEDGLAAARAAHDPWPRAVSLVSGPSRTADIAGIVVRPAHGPKKVFLLLVGDVGAQPASPRQTT